MPASDTPPPVVAVWDATANCYVQASAPVCVAAGRSAGSLCGGKVFRRLGGAELCAEHYDRAMYDRRAVFQQEDEDYGWRYETQRQQWDPDAAEVVYYLLRESDGLIKIGTTARRARPAAGATNSPRGPRHRDGHARQVQALARPRRVVPAGGIARGLDPRSPQSAGGDHAI